MLSKIRKYTFFLLLALVAIFALQNLATMEVNFLFWSVAVPRAVLVAGLLALGALLGWLVAEWTPQEKPKAEPAPPPVQEHKYP